MFNTACLNHKLFCCSDNLACLAIEGIKIMYLWDENGGSDLDTKTTCLEESVGYGKGGGVEKKMFLSLDRDDMSSNGRETVTIYNRKIRKLQSSVTVSLAAAWFGTPDGGDFRIKLSWGSLEREKKFSTSRQYSDGYYSCGSVTFDLLNRTCDW